jgi:hypothetical protein
MSSSSDVPSDEGIIGAHGLDLNRTLDSDPVVGPIRKAHAIPLENNPAPLKPFE